MIVFIISGTHHSGYPSEPNYANIQINIAPPTPTSKDFRYGDVRYEQIGLHIFN